MYKQLVILPVCAGHTIALILVLFAVDYVKLCRTTMTRIDFARWLTMLCIKTQYHYQSGSVIIKVGQTAGDLPYQILKRGPTGLGGYLRWTSKHCHLIDLNTIWQVRLHYQYT